MQHIARRFRLAGAVDRIEPFGNGHINDTFRVFNRSPAAPDYLLQRINHRVFPDVAGLMRNLERVTDHLRSRLAEPAFADCGQTTLRIVPTLDGQHCTRDRAGNYWRVCEFFRDLRSYDFVVLPRQAYEGGRSYGYFLRLLADLPPDRIVEVLPDFHSVPVRLRAFHTARAASVGGRERRCGAAIETVGALARRMTEIERLRLAGELPVRIVHNDTKFNNVLLTADDRGRCVVDLDTVMPGLVHYDFGDAIRTGASTAGEDEPDLQLVGVDREKVAAFAAGYLGVTRDLLTPREIEFLPLSGALLAYLMGMRFLTDYLAGDPYYKIDHPEHNLVRARNQLRLCRELLAQLPELTAAIRKA